MYTLNVSDHNMYKAQTCTLFYYSTADKCIGDGAAVKVLWRIDYLRDYLIKRVFIKQKPSHAIEQANQEVQQEDHHSQHESNQARQMHSNFRIFEFRVYLNLYTRLFTKLNLHKISLYGTFITMKFPDLWYVDQESRH